MSEVLGTSYSPEKVKTPQLSQPKHPLAEGNSLLRKQGEERLLSDNTPWSHGEDLMIFVPDSNFQNTFFRKELRMINLGQQGSLNQISLLKQE